MRDGRRWGLATLLGTPLAAAVGAGYWLSGGEAMSGLVLGASAWPFVLIATYVVVRYRGRDAEKARERAGITTDDEWISLRRAVAGKEVPVEPRVRAEAIVQLRRSARGIRSFAFSGAVMFLLASTQTVFAVRGGPWLTPVLGWFVVALTVSQVLLTRIHGRRADALEAAPDDPPSAI